jgi:hypothetical protein
MAFDKTEWDKLQNGENIEVFAAYTAKMKTTEDDLGTYQHHSKWLQLFRRAPEEAFGRTPITSTWRPDSLGGKRKLRTAPSEEIDRKGSETLPQSNAEFVTG